VNGPPLELPARYVFSGTVLKGGQGSVYVCRDENLARDVAIKFHEDSTDLDILRDEIRSLRSVESKHVVQIYDILQEGDIIGLVQEFIPGSDLSDHAATFATPGHYLKLLYQIAAGIADIHAAGKIHRDIKPNNMKLDSENILKIFDFGLACDQSPAPVTAAARGTHAFRSPELYRTTPVTFTSAVDTYAFGVSAWFLLSGSIPEALLELPPQIRTRPPSFSEHPLTLPTEIVALLDATISLNPNDRPGMSIVRDAIKTRILEGQHRGCFVHNGTAYELSSTAEASKINVPGKGSVSINYDGLFFRITETRGDVSINGIPAASGTLLPGSSVIIIGDASAPAQRAFITFDISHPEVVL
jgi:eukaryotic-like serine/threonine-protein kinase